MSSESPRDQHPRIPAEELHLDASKLVAEIDARLNSSDWQFAGEKESETKGRLLLAAAMRHCARLLSELDAADSTNLLFATRLIARTLYDSLSLTVYLSFFEDVGYEQARSHFKAHVNEVIGSVRRINARISADALKAEQKWVPPLVSTDSLEKLSKSLGTSRSKLDFGEMVRRISEADGQGFFRENLQRIRLIYGAASLFAPHTNYWVLKGYFYSETHGELVPTLEVFSGNDTSRGDRLFTMHLSACVAVLVLQTDSHPMEEAHRIINKYEAFVGTSYDTAQDDISHE
jgi:hypothetical protein